MSGGLRRHRFNAPGLQLAYDSAFDAMLAAVTAGIASTRRSP
jgi:hypothetical protein